MYTEHYIWFFLNKSLILSIILCNPQFYHIYVRGKSLDLYANVSPFFFNNTLVVLVCLSLYLSFYFPKYLQFYKLIFVILNFNIHMLDENFHFFSENISISFFNYILIVFVSLSLYLWKLPQKSSNFSFPINFQHFIRYMLCKLLQIYQKISSLPFHLYYYFNCMPTIVSVKITTNIFKF